VTFSDGKGKRGKKRETTKKNAEEEQKEGSTSSVASVREKGRSNQGEHLIDRCGQRREKGEGSGDVVARLVIKRRSVHSLISGSIQLGDLQGKKRLSPSAREDQRKGGSASLLPDLKREKEGDHIHSEGKEQGEKKCSHISVVMRLKGKTRFAWGKRKPWIVREKSAVPHQQRKNGERKMRFRRRKERQEGADETEKKKEGTNFYLGAIKRRIIMITKEKGGGGGSRHRPASCCRAESATIGKEGGKKGGSPGKRGITVVLMPGQLFLPEALGSLEGKQGGRKQALRLRTDLQRGGPFIKNEKKKKRRAGSISHGTREGGKKLRGGKRQSLKITWRKIRLEEERKRRTLRIPSSS